ncbi:MAG: FGGY-family carbohydrate kinase [Anaerolineae bacterium]
MSRPALLMGVDIGTQGVKGVLVDAQGTVRASAGIARGPGHPRPGWAEMDAERDWWIPAAEIMRRLAAQAKEEIRSLAAVGVCGLVPCLCPLDAEGRPIRPAILYSDNRALEELAWANARAGLSLTAEAVVPKLLWLQRHEPDIFARTATVLSAHNYVVLRLTGRHSMDYDTASIMGGIFDPREKRWDAQVCRQLGIPMEIWPPLYPAIGVVGEVSPDAAWQTNLPAGVPVIAGTGDTFPTIVGCGAVEPGDAMLSFGTTGLLTITRRPLVESVEGPHFSSADGTAAVDWGANILSAGRLVEWFLREFGEPERIVAERTGQSPFYLLEEAASRVPPGAEGLIALPHWLGRRTPTPNATLRGAILGLSPSHSAAHIYRALMESFAFNVRQSLPAHRSSITRLVATAGGARSRLWRQICSDVLDMPMEYYPPASGALGTAFLAGWAVGQVADFSAIRTQWLKELEMVWPDAGARAIYDRLFPIYEEFDAAVAGPFAHLAEMKGRE